MFFNRAFVEGGFPLQFLAVSSAAFAIGPIDPNSTGVEAYNRVRVLIIASRHAANNCQNCQVPAQANCPVTVYTPRSGISITRRECY